MDVNKIFVIYLAPKPHFEGLVLTNPIKGVNGLCYHAKQNRLYACSFVMGDVPTGELGFIDLHPSIKQFTPLIDRSGGYDGIALADDSIVVVSDWVAFEKKMEGAILKYSLISKKMIMEKQTIAPTLKKQPLSESVTVNAPAAKVWQALTDPAIIRKYFFGTEAQSDWKEGSPITYRGEWKGQQYQDKGTILQIKPNQLLQHTYWSSMAGIEDEPENYITVTYKLSGNDKQTTLTVSQDKCVDAEESKQMWHDILGNLKKTVEGQL
jgi:uncharacterized protein YndB with AHSA1/START domain